MSHAGFRASAIFGPLTSLALALIFMPTPAAAQGQGLLRGRVLTTEGAPLPGARVEVVERHLVETTHAEGGFSFPQLGPGQWTLAVSAIGYRPVVRPVRVEAGMATLEIRLAATVIELETIVVTGTVVGRPGSDVLSPSSVVSGGALARRQDLTVAATIAGEPGVATTSDGPSTARPVIRGLSGDRIVLLEDGVRPGDMSSTSSDHAVAIDGLTAGQIDIVRGPMSLLYGSSAMGGVVNVVRNEVPTSLPDHPHGEVRAQGATVNDGGGIGGWLTGATGTLAYRVEGSGRTYGDSRTPGGLLANSGGSTIQAAVGGAKIGSRGHAGGAYRYYESEYGVPGPHEHEHEEEEEEEEEGHDPAEGVRVGMSRHTARFEGEHHPSGRFDLLRASAMFTDYTHREMDPDGDSGTSFHQVVVVTDLAARHGALGPASLGAFGLRAQYRNVSTGGTLRTPDTRDFALAGYVVEEFPVGPLHLQAGLRYDWARFEPHDTLSFVEIGSDQVPIRPRNFGAFTGALGAMADLGGGVRAGMSLSRAYRTPDFNELYSNGPHLAAYSYDVGNPDLAAEAGIGVDAWVRVDRDRVRAELSVFGNWLHDYIFPTSQGEPDFSPDGELPRFQYTNTDARFLGAEGSLALQVGNRWVVEGTVSSVFAAFTSARPPIATISGTDTTFVPASPYPPLIPPVNGRVEARYETPGFHAGLGTDLVARQDRTGDFETATAGYALLDAFLGVRWPLAGRLHTVTLRVDNLLDASYRDHLSRLKRFSPMPGRGLTLNYGLTL